MIPKPPRGGNHTEGPAPVRRNPEARASLYAGVCAGAQVYAGARVYAGVQVCTGVQVYAGARVCAGGLDNARLPGTGAAASSR